MPAPAAAVFVCTRTPSGMMGGQQRQQPLSTERGTGGALYIVLDVRVQAGADGN